MDNQREEILQLEILEALESHWRIWLEELFPNYCYHDFAPHQAEHWQWVWDIKRNRHAAPRIEIWSRGHGKSTTAELSAVAFGARQTRRYILYVSESQKQADKHVSTIESMLGSEAIEEYYPQLGKRRLSKYGHSKGWSGSRLVTASGLVVDALGLDSAARGVKFEDARPDLIILDDIDGKHDTPATTQKKIEIITTSILPAGAAHCITLFVQNLIHRDSIASRLASKQRADFLADRVVSGPIPALENFSYEKRQGQPGYKITGGIPTWAGMDVEKCQKILLEIGLEAFLRECQHDVSLPVGGAIYPQWSELHHLISWSQFLSLFGRFTYGEKCMPMHWKLARGQDWGSTKDHPCVTTWMAKAGENGRLAGSVFAYRELVCIGDTPRQVAEKIKQLEAPYREAERMQISVMSHEAKSERDTYRKHHHLNFSSATPDRNGGIAQTKDYLQVDMSKPHPFKEGVMGCPKIFYVVDDEQLENPFDDAGFARLRAERPAYHYDEPVAGEAVHILRPYSFFNDAEDSNRMIADHFFPTATKKTLAEQLEEALPPELQIDPERELSAEEKVDLWFERKMELDRLKEERRKKRERELPVYWQP